MFRYTSNVKGATMAKSKRKPVKKAVEFDGKQIKIIFDSQPVSVHRTSQASCELILGARSEKVVVKSYQDSLGDAVDDALKNYRKAMVGMRKIKK